MASQREKDAQASFNNPAWDAELRGLLDDTTLDGPNPYPYDHRKDRNDPSNAASIAWGYAKRRRDDLVEWDARRRAFQTQSYVDFCGRTVRAGDLVVWEVGKTFREGLVLTINATGTVSVRQTGRGTSHHYSNDKDKKTFVRHFSVALKGRDLL